MREDLLTELEMNMPSCVQTTSGRKKCGKKRSAWNSRVFTN